MLGVEVDKRSNAPSVRLQEDSNTNKTVNKYFMNIVLCVPVPWFWKTGVSNSLAMDIYCTYVCCLDHLSHEQSKVKTNEQPLVFTFDCSYIPWLNQYWTEYNESIPSTSNNIIPHRHVYIKQQQNDFNKIPFFLFFSFFLFSQTSPFLLAVRLNIIHILYHVIHFKFIQSLFCC